MNGAIMSWFLPYLLQYSANTNAAVEHADRAYFAALGDDAPSFTNSLAILDRDSAVEE